MKTWIFFALAFTALSFVACDGQQEATPDTNILSQDEIADLLFLREEEKLARDVYLFSLDLYDQQIFANISSSEQTHMDEVLNLLQKYDIEDPANSERGVFTNPDLQALYDQMVSQSANSLLDALVVGATIEDLDISDLRENISGTTKSDLLVVYEILQCGSRNHLRAYSTWIADHGGTYSPQFIDQEEYDAILAGSHEHCRN